ncbi:hypothetical protein I4X03_003685 [Massilia sp. R798]|uniref:Uncharacterized protein n=1 Tax=Massilia soli TaxID=2792854 RepID=A0ABS7SK92_9BURK|nr:hypothetical protein [Massilia soli]
MGLEHGLAPRWGGLKASGEPDQTVPGRCGLVLLAFVVLPSLRFFQFFRFFKHAAMLDALAHHFRVLLGGHRRSSHQVFQLRGIGVVTFHRQLILGFVSEQVKIRRGAR